MRAKITQCEKGGDQQHLINNVVHHDGFHLRRLTLEHPQDRGHFWWWDDVGRDVVEWDVEGAYSAGEVAQIEPTLPCKLAEHLQTSLSQLSRFVLSAGRTKGLCERQQT